MRRALVLRAERLARILDEREPVLLGDRAQRRRARTDSRRCRPRRSPSSARSPPPRPPRDRGCSVRASMSANTGTAALVDEAVRARRERVRRRDHFVALADTGRDAQQVQPRRPRRDGRRVRRADLRCERAPRSGRSSARARAGPSAARRGRAPPRARRDTAPRAGPASPPASRLRRLRRGRVLEPLRPPLAAAVHGVEVRLLDLDASPGPGGPITWSSTSRIGVTSAAVPHHEDLVGEIEIRADQRASRRRGGRDPARSG